MNADGMVAYYAPLYEWLKAENERLGLKSEWDASKNEYYAYDENMDFIGKCADEKPEITQRETLSFMRQFVKNIKP